MRIRKRRAAAPLRSIALLSLAAFAAPFVAPPLTQAQSTNLLPVVQALSTRQKVVLLAGAAALYWLYRHHQNAQAEGPNGRYYRSKNGRIYYRDPRTHQAIWVTPPPTSQPLAVPADEYTRMTGQPPPGPGPGGGANPVITALPAASLPVAQGGTLRQPAAGMSTREKVVLLAGAAALYWLYKQHQNSRGEGPNGQYYRSKNGRIYYRDPQTHQAVWVTPPPASQPIAVPADDYQRLTGQVPPTDTNAAGNSRVLTAPPGPPGPASR